MVTHEYLYAVVDRLPPSWCGSTSGVTGTPVETRSVGDFVLLRNRVAMVPTATPKTLAAHHDVVAAVMDAEAMVPFRFGTTVRAGELDAWLTSRGAVLRATLSALRGCVEMNVKLLRLEVAVRAADADGDLRRGVPLETLGERLVARAGIENWSYHVQGRGGNVAASVAFLVRHGEVADFLTRIAPIASRAAGVAVVPTGPWPPYSFVPPLSPGVVDDRLAEAGAPAPTLQRRVS